jgi:hypothetical protein
VPSGFVVRVHVVPPNSPAQSVGIRSPPGPRPGRNQNSSRSGAAGSASAFANHACALETWLGTMSTIIRIPAACASVISASAPARVPKTGSMSRKSATS